MRLVGYLKKQPKHGIAKVKMIKNLTLHKALIRDGHFQMLGAQDSCGLMPRDLLEGKLPARQQHRLSLVAMRSQKGSLLEVRNHSDFSTSRLFR